MDEAQTIAEVTALGSLAAEAEHLLEAGDVGKSIATSLVVIARGVALGAAGAAALLDEALD